MLWHSTSYNNSTSSVWHCFSIWKGWLDRVLRSIKPPQRCVFKFCGLSSLHQHSRSDQRLQLQSGRKALSIMPNVTIVPATSWAALLLLSQLQAVDCTRPYAFHFTRSGECVSAIHSLKYLYCFVETCSNSQCCCEHIQPQVLQQTHCSCQAYFSALTIQLSPTTLLFIYMSIPVGPCHRCGALVLL